MLCNLYFIKYYYDNHMEDGAVDKGIYYNRSSINRRVRCGLNLIGSGCTEQLVPPQEEIFCIELFLFCVP
jgi:hypothetical protein